MFMFLFVVLILAIVGVVLAFAVRISVPFIIVGWEKADAIGRRLSGMPAAPPVCRFCGRKQL